MLDLLLELNKAKTFAACGLLKPDDGGGTALGYDIIEESRTIKSRVGYMTQRFSLYGDLTVRENLTFMARLHALKDVKQTLLRIGGIRSVFFDCSLSDVFDQ